MASTILAIDDDSEVLDLYKMVFGHEGYTVITCSDPLKAFALAKEFSPECIVLDLCLPEEQTGIRIAQALKEDNCTKDIPIIFITSNSDSKSRLQAFTAGGLDLINKPFKIKDIVQRLKPAVDLGRLQKVMSRVMDRL